MTLGQVLRKPCRKGEKLDCAPIHVQFLEAQHDYPSAEHPYWLPYFVAVAVAVAVAVNESVNETAIKSRETEYKVDGTTAFTSPTLTQNQAAVPVVVYLCGASTLELIVT